MIPARDADIYRWVKGEKLLMVLEARLWKKQLMINIFDEEIKGILREKMFELRNSKEQNDYSQYEEITRPTDRVSKFLVTCEYSHNPNWDINFVKILNERIGIDAITPEKREDK